MKKDSLKTNQSSIQVLKTLKLLMKGDYTMAELIEKLNENEPEPIFNNSVVSKYINTCRQCLIDIPKIQNKYFLAKLPFGLQLKDDEVAILQKLKDVINEEMSSKSQNIFQSFIDILNRYANKKITRFEKDSLVSAFESFERALNNRKKVVLLFKNRYELKGIPVDIVTEKGKVFFLIYCKNRIRMIDAGRLAGIHTTDENFLGYDKEQSIVFKLKGKLAKRYDLRPEETVINTSDTDDSITISNRCYNSEMLFSRLMRYDELCEIRTPNDVREQMKTLIDDTLKNYGIE
ncbi:WYL domain-containing protein [bacterium]|nr:WYL domain-containing protein [bacterium]